MEVESPKYDDGESLHDAMARFNIGDLEHELDAMRELHLRIGRKAEPTPIVKLALERTKTLKREHALKTNGEAMECFITELRQREDVREWQNFRATWETDRDKRAKINIDEELKKRSVHVQAFAKYGHMDRQTLGGELRQMKRDNPDFA
ncbi:MAG: hypothetical protein ABI700_16330 [Chloroflexota bacterium]